MKLLIALAMFIVIELNAQNYPRKEMDLSLLADDLYGSLDDELNDEEIYENLAQLLSHPLDLNKATADDLGFLRILSEEQVNTLLTYRAENGNFISIYELQVVPGFDLETLYRFAPFVKVTDPLTTLDRSFLKRIRDESDNYFLLRYEQTLQTKKGFRTDHSQDRFKGSPGKWCIRFRSSRPADFSFGFTTEKDPGETITWDPAQRQYGFDHFSFHAQVQNKGKLKNLVVGDYQSQFGQGLMFGGIFGMGKGSETITTARKSNIGFLPYTSAYEAGNLRGVATTVTINKHFHLNSFYSSIRRDATVTNNETPTAIIQSFQTTGLHRNDKELASRKNTIEQNLGGVLQYKKDQLEASIMLHHIRFGAPVERNPTPYNQFIFRGSENRNAGLYLGYTFENVSVFGEAAHSLEKGSAWIAGALLSLTSHLDVAVLHRRFDRNFHSFYSSAFAEGTAPQNETGTYWGWKYRFNRRFTTTGYADLFRFPWLRYRSYAPSSGYEWLGRINYQPSRKTLVFGQIREEQKARNLSDGSTLYQTGKAVKRNYCIHVEHGIGQPLRLKTRAQFSTFRFAGNISHGSAIVQDLSFEAGRLQITCRYALFDTDDYDNRQYVYENDVWLSYSLPAYDGVGVRSYILLEYKWNKHITLWMRYAQTRYTDREEIGSGLETIHGNKRNDIKFELRIKF